MKRKLIKGATARHVKELQQALESSNRKADKEIAKLRKRLADHRWVNRERNAELERLVACKVALAAVVANYFAAKMGDRRCQGQLDGTIRMAADVLVLAEPGPKDGTGIYTVSPRGAMMGDKPS